MREGRSLAQDHLDPVRLGGRPKNPSSIACAPAAAPKRRAALSSILTAAYQMLYDGTLYHDLSPDHFDRRAKTVQTRRLITRLQELGYAVEITPCQHQPGRFLSS